MPENIKVKELYRGTGGAIGQNASITTDYIDMRRLRLDGNFALHMISVGGTITVTVLVCSTSKGTFIAPDTPITVINAGAAGSFFAAFTPPVAAFMKLKFTETNVAAVTAMDAWLNYQ